MHGAKGMCITAFIASHLAAALFDITVWSVVWHVLMRDGHVWGGLSGCGEGRPWRGCQPAG